MSLAKTDSISLNLKPLFCRKLFCFNFSLVSELGPSLNFFEKVEGEILDGDKKDDL